MTVLLTFKVACVIFMTSCTKSPNTNTIVEPPRVDPPISSWDGPPILSSQRIGESGAVCRERPLLHDDQILQLFEVKQPVGLSEWHVGAFNWKDTSANKLLDTIYSVGGRPAYTSMRCNSIGKCVFWGGIVSTVYDAPTQTLTQNTFEHTSECFALADGSLWLTGTKMPNDSFFTVSSFDPTTFDTSHLFKVTTPITNYAYSIREGMFSNRNNEVFIYIQTEYYNHNLNASPSIIHCFNLTQNKIEWSKEYDRVWPQDNSQSFGLDDRYVYTHGYNRVVAYDLETGETIWTYDGPSGESLSFCPVMVGGGRVYVFNDNGGVIGLNRETGARETFTEGVQPTVSGADKFGDRYVLLGMGNSSIVIFNPETAQVDLSFKSPTHNLSEQRQFIWDNFSAYYDLGYIVAHDYEYVYVFDVSGY